MKKSPPAFTLIEILCVMTIIALLSGILFAAFQPARERARRTNCISNLHQIWTAIQMYRTDYDGNEAVKGQANYCPELGLPCNSPEPLKKYLKNKAVLFCPEFHGFFPTYNDRAEYVTTTYIWSMDSVEDDRPYDFRFSTRVSIQGDELPILIDESHNRPFTLQEPRWVTKSVTFVRLNGQALTKQLPVRSQPSDGW